MNRKPVILLFIDWFSPGYKAGGPIASCINFIQLMKHDYAIYVFTGNTDLGETIPYKDIVPDTWIEAGGGYKIFYAQTKQLGLQQIKAVTAAVNPDFVYLNHLFSPKFVVYPLWLKWKGIITSKVVICPRGALYKSALSVKPYKKIPFLKLFRWMRIPEKVRFHSTSQREQQAILQYFPGSEVVTADDLPSMVQLPFTTLPKQPGVLKCIYVARIHPIKNLLLLLEALNKVKAAVQLSIVGPVEDKSYWQKCQAQIRLLPATITVDYKGSLPNKSLLPVLKDHHLFIMPTLGENFGHSIFESFLLGRPVLISDQTPWLQLEQQQLGWDLPLDSPDRFTAAIETAAAWDQASFTLWGTKSWEYAKNFIENRGLKQQYLQLFS
jgi:glycosyltransferase involved in cell wall biosynthesis